MYAPVCCVMCVCLICMVCIVVCSCVLFVVRVARVACEYVWCVCGLCTRVCYMYCDQGGTYCMVV